MVFDREISSHICLLGSGVSTSSFTLRVVSVRCQAENKIISFSFDLKF